METNQAKRSIFLVAILGSNLLSKFIDALSTPTAPAPVNKAVPALDNGMDYVKLGSSDLLVSKVCMGTMTFGEVRLQIIISFTSMA